MTKDVDNPGRRGVAVAAELLSVLFVYAVITLILYGQTFGESFNIDGFRLIGGTIMGNQWRLTMHYILHWICPLLFGDNLAAYRLPSLILHLMNAVLVFQLFILLFQEIKTSIGHSRLHLHAGGVVAGLLFLLYDSFAPRALCHLCYQLVVSFSLSMFIFGLLYFRTGRSRYWIGAILSYGFALLSHSYSLTLPLFVLILEYCVRRKRGRPFNSRGMVPRYAALGILFAAFLWRYWGELTSGINGFGSGVVGSTLLHFPQYLWLAALRFWPGELVPGSVEAPAAAAVLIVLCGICALGIREIVVRDRTLGMAGVLVLFFVCWNGLVFLQTTAGEAAFFGWWRYYFHAVGIAITASFVMIRAIQIALQSIRWLPERILFMIVIVGLPLGVMTGNASIRHRLTRFMDQVSGNRLFQPLFVRGDDKECGRIEAMTPDQVRRSLDSTRNLRCRRLRNIDLRGLDLSHVDLGGSDLTHADLSGSDLRGARLEGSFLIGATLEAVDLRGAILERATLSGADLRDTDLAGAVLNEALLHGVNLRGVDIRNVEMKGANLSDGDLVGADLSGADLSWTSLRRIYLAGADLREAALEGIKWGSLADLSGADLTGANLMGATLNGATLKMADLSGADLREADLRGSNMKGAMLKGADLTRADLSSVDLTGADLRKADLTRAGLNGTVLMDADLTGALLRGVDLRKTDLTGVDLEVAVLEDVTMNGVTYYPSARAQ